TFAADVQRYLNDEPVLACPPSVGYRLRKFVRRNKGPMLTAAALAALLVLGTVCTSVGLVWALQAERAEAEHRRDAEKQRDRARDAELLATERLHQVTQEKERATDAESNTRAFSEFLVNDVLAVARPKG